MFTADGWLNTGDTARMDSAGHLYITGRLKEIIVLSNGEKVPPVDMETAIIARSVFRAGHGARRRAALPVGVRGARTRTVGQGRARARARPGLAGVLAHSAGGAAGARAHQRADQGIPWLCADPPRCSAAEPWTIENGLLTPTLKLKRAKVLEHHASEYDKLYSGTDMSGTIDRDATAARTASRRCA